MTANLKTVLLTAALVAAAGCGGDKKTGNPPPAGGAPANSSAAGGDKGAAASGKKYDAATSTASVSGTVKFTGTKPADDVLTIKPSSDAFCMEHAKSIVNDKFVVAADGSLPNCFIWAQKGPHKEMSGFPASPKVTLDQSGCTYVPHIFGLRVGEAFTVKNSDSTTHNVHARPKTNKDFLNKPQNANQSDDFTYDQKETAIPINCDIHTWMSAYAFVLDHPFFAVTDASGKFSIKGLPAGTYTFRVWHESFTADKTEMQQDFEVTVKDGEAATKDVELK